MVRVAEGVAILMSRLTPPRHRRHSHDAVDRIVLVVDMIMYVSLPALRLPQTPIALHATYSFTDQTQFGQLVPTTMTLPAHSREPGIVQTP